MCCDICAWGCIVCLLCECQPPAPPAPEPVAATSAAAGTTLVLAGVMGQRANRSGKVFPAGVVAILSALMSIGYARTLA